MLTTGLSGHGCEAASNCCGESEWTASTLLIGMMLREGGERHNSDHTVIMW